MHQKRVRVTMAALYPHRRRQSIHIIWLCKRLNIDLAFGIAVTVEHGLTILRNPRYRIRSAFRSRHRIRQAIAIKLASFRASGCDMPEHRDAAEARQTS